MAEREVVGDGVVLAEARERPGDLLGRTPRRVPAAGEAEIAGKPVDVDIDRNEQARGSHRPHPEVDAVGRARHPPEEEQQTLATARAARIGEKVRRAPAPSISTEAARDANGVAKGRERDAKGAVGALARGRRARELPLEERAERPVLALHGAGSGKKAGEILPAEDARAIHGERPATPEDRRPPRPGGSPPGRGVRRAW